MLGEAEAALSEAMSIRISILGETHTLSEKTRKKFELARSLVKKDIESQQKKEKKVSFNE